MKSDTHGVFLLNGVFRHVKIVTKKFNHERYFHTFATLFTLNFK